MALRAPERFDADPSAYAEYLRTPLGRLRLELSWRNLEPHLLRRGSPPRRALDLGGGTGELTLRLAAAGWSVTFVDGSPRMLEQVAAAADGRGLGERIACRALDLDADGLAGALGVGSYDLVVCHHVLEYVASPERLLAEARTALADRGRLSLVVRNRGGEAMKQLLRGAGPAAALELLAARRLHEGMYGLDVRLLDAAEIHALVRAVGLSILAEHGVRVAADYLPDWDRDDAGFDRMVALELRLGERDELRPLARYVQVIAARDEAPRSR